LDLHYISLNHLVVPLSAGNWLIWWDHV